MINGKVTTTLEATIDIEVSGPNPTPQQTEAVIDQCDLCGDELKPGQTTLEIWRDEELVVIREVPADVCQQCHEAYFSAATSERLDRFLGEYQQHRPERYLAVPQFAALQVMEW